MWDNFIPPRSWYDSDYVELKFDKYTPSADVLVGKTITKGIADNFDLPEEYIGKIVESVEYPR